MITWLLANKKLIGYATSVLALIASMYKTHTYIYDSGRESMRVEMVALQNKALEEARKTYEKDVEKSLLKMQHDYQDELERVRNEKETTTKIEKVTEYVDREIIVKPECDILAADIISVFKQATDIIATTSHEEN